MIAETLFHILLSNVERKENIEYIRESGLPSDWSGRDQWVNVEIHDNQQWRDTLYMFMEAVEQENNNKLDKYISKLFILNLAF